MDCSRMTVPQQDPDSKTPLNSEAQTRSTIKRVSFDENQVKTFVYEKDVVDGPSERIFVKQPFTAADKPPNRITVVAEHSETPNVILPPTQVEETRPAPQSPPLPALVKRMENETENPFRPEEQLFHEVDPIVEAYMKKPYPRLTQVSPGATPVKNANQAFVNGISPTSLLPEKELEKPITSSTPLSTPNKNDQPIATDEPDLPKPSQVECVHIKKKKCGCCNVQ